MTDNRVIETLKEMLEQRGYTVEDKSEGMIGSKRGRSSIIVFFNLAPKVNNERIQDYITRMTNLDVKHSIIVYTDSVTSQAQKVIDELQDMRMELFHMNSLRYNITKHRLVPKHTQLTKAEAKAFKETYGTKIPILMYTDPVARFYDFQRGDVIRVNRPNGFVCFRVVK
jgi:DNA-directed RNA polymerase I, II, and III subunit RPABC1